MSRRMDNEDDDLDRIPNYAHWVPDEALKNLSMERTLHGNETSAQLARRLLEENSPMAVARLVHMALQSPDEKISLMATKYIVDQTIGTPSSPMLTGTGESAIDQVMGAVLVEAEEIAAQAAKYDR